VSVVGAAAVADAHRHTATRGRELYGALCTPRAAHFEPRALNDGNGRAIRASKSVAVAVVGAAAAAIAVRRPERVSE